MAKTVKLYIDLDKCSGQCPECVVECSYFYHDKNNGIFPLRELLTYALICRRCEEAHCVNSCPQNALEKQADNILKRYLMRCIGCKSCSHGCPYGVILPELVPYLNGRCDLCLDRGDGREPVCIPTCPYKAIELKEIQPNEQENLYQVGENLIVHSTHWIRAKA